MPATSAYGASEGEAPRHIDYPHYPAAPQFQSWEDAEPKSAGCHSCHTVTDRKTMHASEAVVLGCTDCHGGDATVFLPEGTERSAEPYQAA
ncbi:MAG: hypothetical protein RLN70_10400, partial [Rhodospirillaceae bacterium]